MIKAIPQKVDGILFRSRAEARWATFFRLTELRYQYEPEGFQLEQDWYVPDFLLPMVPVYVEVKPGEPNEREVRVAKALAAAARVPVMIAMGNPCQTSRLLWVDVTGSTARCCLVSEYNKERGVWVTESADGGGWAVSLHPGLRNCSATGETHPALVKAGMMQFRKPDLDHGVSKARREIANMQSVVSDLLARVNAMDAESDSA